MEKLSQVTREIMNERFGHDALIALATSKDDKPFVRAVNAYYEDGSFYIITWGLSDKMKQIEANPTVAVCGEWFTAGGIGENMGYLLSESNKALALKLKQVFSAWYGNGHIDENDTNTCILRVRLTEGVLLCHGTRYEIDFT